MLYRYAANAFPCLNLIDAVLISEINSSPRIRVRISNYALIARTTRTDNNFSPTHALISTASRLFTHHYARVHASVLVFVKIR